MRTIVLCTTLEKDCLKTLNRVKDKIDLDDSKIIIVSIIKTQTFTFNLSPYIFPESIHYALIEEQALKVMKELGDSLGIDPSQINYKCSFEFEVKSHMKSILEETKADLAVVATREKHGIKGFFSSSFAEYLIKFSPCDILVMRPQIIK
jgi:nucleotide-binding universal stress UspA family protein